MSQTWEQAALQRFIDDHEEESQCLEYKAAEALGKEDQKKADITKDVSAMANAAGGLVVYGIKEYGNEEKRHLPEKLDGIDRTKFTREWIEQVINNIEPRIDGLQIHDVELDTGKNHVAYVVAIPQSTTAHQARDYRYYRRYNFGCQPMHDYEIRDVMNRAVTPNLEVTFSPAPGNRYGQIDGYRLRATIRNKGPKLVKHWQLAFTFPLRVLPDWPFQSSVKSVLEVVNASSIHDYWQVSGPSHLKARFASSAVIFPLDAVSLCQELDVQYIVDLNAGRVDTRPMISWMLWADDMVPKSGVEDILKLHGY